MQVNKSEQVRPFDVDNCLISYDYQPKKGMIAADVVDPVTGKNIRVRVNKAMVRLLREEYQRGGHIKVWSRSGWEWARNVVQALELVPYVHEVLSKPIAYFDDTDVSEWMKDRVFIGPDVKYKE